MEKSTRRRWEDLDAHILRRIFSLSDLSYDLSGNVSKVCRSWRLCCWDILFWEKNTLDLSATMGALGNIDSFTRRSFKLRYLVPRNHDLLKGLTQIDSKLMKLLESIIDNHMNPFGISLEHWRLSIRILSIPEDLEISDEHLLYISERTPRLERLDLHGTSRITNGGFAKALCNWKHVKHINLGRFCSSQYFPYILEEIGKTCHELVTLKVSGRFNFPAGIAYAAIKNLPLMDKRKFEVAYLLRDVIIIFLSNCLKLEEIHFNDCFINYEHTGLIEWTRMSFIINLGRRERARRWHFEAGNKGIEQVTESSLLDQFKLWMDEKPSWLELGPLLAVCEFRDQSEGA